MSIHHHRPLIGYPVGTRLEVSGLCAIRQKGLGRKPPFLIQNHTVGQASSLLCPGQWSAPDRLPVPEPWLLSPQTACSREVTLRTV